MGLFSKFFKSTRKGHTVVLDIGSATVGISLVNLNGAGTPEILYLKRHSIVFEKGVGQDVLARSLGAAITKAGSELHENIAKKNLHSRIQNIHVIVHAPWVDSRSERKEASLAKESKVTEEILQQFVDRQFDFKAPPGRTLFDHHMSRIELNGYATDDPYGKRARDLTVTMLVSSMPELVYQELQDAIATVFPDSKVHVDGFIPSVTQHAHEIAEGTDEYTLVDIGGEYTTLHVIRGASIAQSARLQLGTLELLRGAGGTDEVDEAAKSALVMYLSNTCTPSQCRKTQKLLAPTQEKWETEFQKALKEASSERALPSTLFVSVDVRFYPWFERFLKQSSFENYTTTKRPFAPKLIRVRGEKRAVNASGGAPDNQLTLATYFADHAITA